MNISGQTYYCNHCNHPFEETFWCFLHIFTTHLHKDIGIPTQKPADRLRVARMLRTCHRYHATAAVIGAN